MNVLGVHLGHDAAAALVSDGRIVASVIEERFLRIKHTSTWPVMAVGYCLREGKIGIEDVDYIAVSSSTANLPNVEAYFGLERHPLARSLYHRLSPSSKTLLPLSLMMRLARRLLTEFSPVPTLSLPTYAEAYKLREGAEVVHVSHHLAHAASAYYTSGIREKCLIVTADGIGEGVSTAVWVGENGHITPLMTIGAEGSLGWAYGTVTEALGWQVNEGEGKTMGLAPYGDPQKAAGVLDSLFPLYKNGQLIRGHSFGHVTGWNVGSVEHWHFPDAVGARALVERHGREHVAAEAQRLLEERMLDIVPAWIRKMGLKKVCAAGGVFLNVKANQRLWETGLLEDFHIYPEAGDGGLALGAALLVWHEKSGTPPGPRIQEAYFGPAYSDEAIEAVLRERHIAYRRCDDIAAAVGKLLLEGRIVGWFQGRMEVGPRALGNRSILIDPRKAENKDILNQRVKFREPFRPFCPSLLDEARADWMVGGREAHFMIVSFDAPEDKAPLIPAVVHVDGTMRPQTVTREANPMFWRLINLFGEATGVPVLLNTSFNIRGEPIVCTPRDALKCFYDTGLDALAIGDFLVEKGAS